MMIKRILFFLQRPGHLFLALGLYGFLSWIPDEQYIKIAYRLNMRKKLDLDNPKTYNEKLQWLKLYDRKAEYATMVDKYRVREYIAKTIGEEYLIPLLGVWENPDDIDFEKLPNQFVLKCNHNSGRGMCFCKDKAALDIPTVRKDLKRALSENYYLQGREWAYKNVKPCIIAEQFMEDSQTEELRDYKFFCFNGKAKALFIATDRQSKNEETKFDFFDMEFNHLDFTNGHPNAVSRPQKPIQFDKMKELAEKLSQGIPHVRVDLYEVNGKIYFGELTFFHWGGMVAFDPEEWDYKFGEWIECKTDS